MLVTIKDLQERATYLSEAGDICLVLSVGKYMDRYFAVMVNFNSNQTYSLECCAADLNSLMRFRRIAPIREVC